MITDPLISSFLLAAQNIINQVNFTGEAGIIYESHLNYVNMLLLVILKKYDQSNLMLKKKLNMCF